MKKLSLLLIGLLFIGVASSVLVSYLSNTERVDVNVQSPLEIISGGLSQVFGGETVVVDFNITNKADAIINGKHYVAVENLAGINCSDFSSIGATDNRSGNVYSSCAIVDNETIRLNFVSDNSVTFSNNEKVEYVLSLTFQSNAMGDYSIVNRIDI